MNDPHMNQNSPPKEEHPAPETNVVPESNSENNQNLSNLEKLNIGMNPLDNSVQNKMNVCSKDNPQANETIDAPQNTGVDLQVECTSNTNPVDAQPASSEPVLESSDLHAVTETPLVCDQSEALMAAREDAVDLEEPQQGHQDEVLPSEEQLQNQNDQTEVQQESDALNQIVEEENDQTQAQQKNPEEVAVPVSEHDQVSEKQELSNSQNQDDIQKLEENKIEEEPSQVEPTLQVAQNEEEDEIKQLEEQEQNLVLEEVDASVKEEEEQILEEAQESAKEEQNVVLEEVDPSVNQEEQMLNEANVAVQEEEPLLEEADPLVPQVEPVMQEASEPIQQEEPLNQEANSLVQGEELQLEEVNPSVNNEEPLLEEVNPSVKDEEPLLEEANPSVKDEEPLLEEVNPSVSNEEEPEQELIQPVETVQPEVTSEPVVVEEKEESVQQEKIQEQENVIEEEKPVQQQEEESEEEEEKTNQPNKILGMNELIHPGIQQAQDSEESDNQMIEEEENAAESPKKTEAAPQPKVPMSVLERNKIVSDEENECNYNNSGSNKIYIWGSGECDQFESDYSETRRPIEMTYFSQNKIKVADIICGSQHSLVLSNEGRVYSWGNSDDGSLGRETNSGGSPGQVPLQEKIDLMSAGEAHSVFANSLTGNIYFTGVLKSIDGKLSQVVETPMLIEHKHIKKNGIQRLISGQNHVMILSGSKLFTFGDNSMGQLGHILRNYNPKTHCLIPHPVSLKSVNRIFTGANHCFAICRKNQVMTWGLNTVGQLGLPYYLDNPEDSDVNHPDPSRNPNVLQKPHLIGGLSGKLVQDIVGGEHHTIVLMKDGTVWGAGRNDEGQLGELVLPSRESYPECQAPNQKVKVAGANIYVEVTEDYMPNKFLKIPMMKPLQRVISRSHYNYGINTDDKGWMKIYSWGAGFNYVLGNGKEDEQRTAFRISNNKLFNRNAPTDIALGHSHVIYYTGDSYEVELDEDNNESSLRKRGSIGNLQYSNSSSLKKVRY
jgi:regulator of chromosome condensation